MVTKSKETEPAVSSKPSSGAVVNIKGGGDPTVAIAFGGGGARGYAHIHIIEVLDEMGIRPVAIAGSSIGGIMGAAVASGMSGKAIRDYALDLASNRVDVAARFWKLRPSGLSELASNGFKLGQFNIERILHNFLPKDIKHDFADLHIPLCVIATDYYAYAQRVFDEGALFPALAASAAIPAVFSPVKVDGRYYVDGGIFNPVPYDQLEGRADVIVGIDVVGVPHGDPTKPPKTIDSIYGASQLMMQSILHWKMKLDPPHVFIRPPVSKYRVQEFFKVKQILEDTVVVREQFKRDLGEALDKAARKPR